MADYAFVTRWLIGAPIEKVFAEIEDGHAWPTWWRGVRAVEVLSPGGEGGIGEVTRNTWRSKLPYDLVFDARLVKKEPPRAIEVEAFGELDGHGRWELVPEGGGTLVTYYWNVKTTKPWMNLLAPIARPFFKWNHDVVMRWGGEGLVKRLGATFEDRSHAR